VLTVRPAIWLPVNEAVTLEPTSLNSRGTSSMQRMIKPVRSHDVAFIGGVVALVVPVYLHARPVLSIVSVARRRSLSGASVTVPTSLIGKNVVTTPAAHSPPCAEGSVIGPLQTPSMLGGKGEAAVGGA